MIETSIHLTDKVILFEVTIETIAVKGLWEEVEIPLEWKAVHVGFEETPLVLPECGSWILKHLIGFTMFPSLCVIDALVDESRQESLERVSEKDKLRYV